MSTTFAFGIAARTPILPSELKTAPAAVAKIVAKTVLTLVAVAVVAAVVAAVVVAVVEIYNLR